MEENKCYIYFHFNPITNKLFYIGIGINDRAYKFKGGRNNSYLEHVNTFGKPIVKIYKEGLTKIEACLLETKLIKKYGRLNIDKKGILLNRSTGGQYANLGVKQSDETKIKKV